MMNLQEISVIPKFDEQTIKKAKRKSIVTALVVLLCLAGITYVGEQLYEWFGWFVFFAYCLRESSIHFVTNRVIYTRMQGLNDLQTNVDPQEDLIPKEHIRGSGNYI